MLLRLAHMNNKMNHINIFREKLHTNKVHMKIPWYIMEKINGKELFEFVGKVDTPQSDIYPLLEYLKA